MARRVHLNFNDPPHSQQSQIRATNQGEGETKEEQVNYEYYTSNPTNYQETQENYNDHYNYQPPADHYNYQATTTTTTATANYNNYDYSSSPYSSANVDSNVNYYYENGNSFNHQAQAQAQSTPITKTSFPIVQPPPLVQSSVPPSNFNNPSSSSQFASYGATDNQNNRHLDKSWIKAFSSGGFENEAPLLEELGINFSHIKAKTLASLNPFRKLDAGTLQDADLAGPLLFCFLFGVSLLLSGKVHFGYIYGVATLGWISIFAILNLMTENGVNFYLTASVLGYCLLPMVLLSAVALLLQLRGFVGIILGITSVSWCTFSSSTFFVSAFGMQNQQILISYPIFLLYSCFALMTIF